MVRGTGSAYICWSALTEIFASLINSVGLIAWLPVSRLVLTDDLRKEGFPVFGYKVLVNGKTGNLKYWAGLFRFRDESEEMFFIRDWILAPTAVLFPKRYRRSVAMFASMVFRACIATAIATCLLPRNEVLVAQELHGRAAATSQGPKTEPKANTDNSAASAPTDADYRIGPQDVVQIDVWNEPEITRTIPVRPDGKISLPLLNDVQAAGLTAMQLAGSIREGLTKYLANPQVTITVTSARELRTKPITAPPSKQPSPDLKQKCCVA